MRKVTDCSRNFIVFAVVHDERQRTDIFQEHFKTLDRFCGNIFCRCEDIPCIFNQSVRGCSVPCLLGACHRVSADKITAHTVRFDISVDLAFDGSDIREDRPLFSDFR